MVRLSIRRLLVLVALAIVTALVQVPLLATPASATPAIPGPGANQSGCTAASGTDVQTQLTRFEDCLGQSWITTRGWGAKFPECVADPKSLQAGAVYTHNEGHQTCSRR